MEIKVHEHGFVRYIDHMGSDTRIVEAARVSYGQPSKGEEADKKLLRYLYRNKHSSPFEMAKITFNIKMPIFVARQFVRHRMQNLNEVSARYTELPSEFFYPASFRVQSKSNKQSSALFHLDRMVEVAMKNEMTIAYEAAYKAYERLLDMGVARELARIVLPVGIYTEIYTTFDLNNLIKFFHLREHPHAQQEIRDFAAAMKTITAQHFPWTIEIYEESRNVNN